MQRRCATLLRLSALAALLATAGPLAARPVTDMAGRQVEVPDTLHRVFPAVTTLTPVLAALAPEQMTSLAFRLSAGAGAFLPPQTVRLPVVNVLENLNAETVLAMRADVLLGWHGPGALGSRTEALAARIGKPLLLFAGERLEQYPAVFRQLGALLGKSKRAEILARDLETRQAQLAAALRDLPAARRPRVYYAESPDGLTSQCDDSSRLEVIRMAGGIPALHCQGGGFGQSRAVDFEAILLLDPDVILARDGRTAAALAASPRWQALRAVRSGRLHGVPDLPFNWFDRPPSFMRALGARWLAGQLHPQRFNSDFRGEVVHFNRLYFGVTPDAATLDRLLGRPS